ncbi:MAG: hypothetical protein F4X18_13800 [Acidimicrobiia bacterium]|nr:hypothetical protein [Acidimicrobiia bacterium]
MATTRNTRNPAQPGRTQVVPAAQGDECGSSERQAGSGIWLKIQSQGGCLVDEGPAVFVPSVEEARRTLARTAREVLEERKPADPDPEFFLFRPGTGSGWDELVRCESYRCYDPRVPDRGMEVSYALYEEGGLSGVGGMIWTYGVYLTVTGPPEVWDHTAHLPCGRDLYD